MTAVSQDVSLPWLIAALLNRPRWTFGLPVTAAAVAALVSFFIRPGYTSTAAFVPESRSTPALSPALLGLASQFGVTLGDQAARSPMFYAQVLRSREVLAAVLRSRFHIAGNPASDSASLLEILRVKGSTPAKRLANGIKKLDKRLATDVDARTSIVRFAVDAPDPELAHDVAQQFMALLNDYNLRRRQSQARERRRFVEERAAAADSLLLVAEDRLKRFYQANRLWQSSPELQFEEGRLRRDVSLRQELELTLNRELESARIEEVNDTPVITIIDGPDVPQQRSRPKRFLMTAAALILGLICGSAGALSAEAISQMRSEGGPDYILLRDALRRLRSRSVDAQEVVTGRDASARTG